MPWGPMRHFHFLIGLFLIVFSQLALAYPEFIGYGYSSCLTCHYNGLGGGPLNDYGRALWSAEIAARPFYSASVSDEEIANQSGFLGSVPLPSYVRPHINYRGMDLRTNPGSASLDRTTWLNMQEDFGLTVPLTAIGNTLVSATWGRQILAPVYGAGTQGFTNILAEEYFLRTQVSEGLWLYVGLMDKVFGIRNVNHTSYQRKYEGFNVYNNNPDGISNSQGVILHQVTETWELAANYFGGNPYDDASYRLTGGSALAEFEVGENKRLGISALYGTSQIKNKSMAAVHYRHQISKGSSLLAEYGVIHDYPTGSADLVGSYNFIEGTVLLTRGYNLVATTERYNSTFNSTSGDNWKWSFGLLMFPFARVEVRAEASSTRTLSTQQASPDAWSMDGQLHVSL